MRCAGSWTEARTPIRNNFIPANFDKIADAAISEFATSVGVEADSLTLYPSYDGSDFWIVVYKDNLLPHPFHEYQ